jgi:hypothetical protein
VPQTEAWAQQAPDRHISPAGHFKAIRQIRELYISGNI